MVVRSSGLSYEIRLADRVGRLDLLHQSGDWMGRVDWQIGSLDCQIRLVDWMRISRLDWQSGFVYFILDLWFRSADSQIRQSDQRLVDWIGGLDGQIRSVNLMCRMDQDIIKDEISRQDGQIRCVDPMPLSNQQIHPTNLAHQIRSVDQTRRSDEQI